MKSISNQHKGIMMVTIAIALSAVLLTSVIASSEQANAIAASKDKLKEKADNLKSKAKELKTKLKDRVSSGGSGSGGSGGESGGGTGD